MQVLPKTSTCAAFIGFRGLANEIIQNFCKIWKKLITQTFSYIACFHVRDKTDFLTCCDDLNLLCFSFFISLKDNTTFEILMPQARLWQVIISGADDKGRHNPKGCHTGHFSFCWQPHIPEGMGGTFPWSAGPTVLKDRWLLWLPPLLTSRKFWSMLFTQKKISDLIWRFWCKW